MVPMHRGHGCTPWEPWLSRGHILPRNFFEKRLASPTPQQPQPPPPHPPHHPDPSCGDPLCAIYEQLQACKCFQHIPLFRQCPIFQRTSSFGLGKCPLRGGPWGIGRLPRGRKAPLGGRMPLKGAETPQECHPTNTPGRRKVVSTALSNYWYFK